MAACSCHAAASAVQARRAAELVGWRQLVAAETRRLVADAEVHGLVVPVGLSPEPGAEADEGLREKAIVNGPTSG